MPYPDRPADEDPYSWSDHQGHQPESCPTRAAAAPLPTPSHHLQDLAELRASGLVQTVEGRRATRGESNRPSSRRTAVLEKSAEAAPARPTERSSRSLVVSSICVACPERTS